MTRPGFIQDDQHFLQVLDQGGPGHRGEAKQPAASEREGDQAAGDRGQDRA